MTQRTRVIDLYKTLVHLGRDYPLGWDYFRPRLKAAFMKNKNVTNPEKIEELIARGNYVVKEIEALYMLKKYRTLKRRYYSEEREFELGEVSRKLESVPETENFK